MLIECFEVNDSVEGDPAGRSCREYLQAGADGLTGWKEEGGGEDEEEEENEIEFATTLDVSVESFSAFGWLRHLGAREERGQVTDGRILQEINTPHPLCRLFIPAFYSGFFFYCEVSILFGAEPWWPSPNDFRHWHRFPPLLLSRGSVFLLSVNPSLPLFLSFHPPPFFSPSSSSSCAAASSCSPTKKSWSI